MNPALCQKERKWKEERRWSGRKTAFAHLCLGFAWQALRRAAIAIEQLAITAREELPGTMAAVRLSGMEISDLTMELSDLRYSVVYVQCCNCTVSCMCSRESCKTPLYQHDNQRLVVLYALGIRIHGTHVAPQAWSWPRVFSYSQEITEGVRTSTRAVKAAEDGIKRMKSYAQTKTVGECYCHLLQCCTAERQSLVHSHH